MFSGAEPFMQFRYRALWGRFVENYFNFELVLQEKMFKEKSYGQRTGEGTMDQDQSK